MDRPFAHLHCHTQFSLLDGMTRIPDLVRKTKQSGMNAVAITDHGNLYGAMDFYRACRAEDVNPVVGMEAYIAPGDRRHKGGATRGKEASFHLTLLAMNAAGFQNLVRLSSKAFLEGFYYKPRIDKEILENHSEGLICLSGCAAGELSHYLLGDRDEEAGRLVDWYSGVFGDRFYMEIQDSGTNIQRECLERTVDLANKRGLPLVATNDAHYLDSGDGEAHDLLLCVNTHTTRNAENRIRMETQEFYVRTPEEMYAAMPDFGEAVARSQEIADRCDIRLEEKKYYPVFHPPEGKTDVAYLRELCEAAIVDRYGRDADKVYYERIDRELGVIEEKGYASYFLIVWDFVEFAKKHEIPCTARGSASGALVAYLLGLSDVCPIKYDLLFERFLDKSRNEPPDIDIDFCRDRRQLVIDYTKEKYGEDAVSQIGTFGTLKAKAVVRDVGRALGVPLPRVNEIAKLIPDTLGIKLKDAVEQTPDLRDAYEADPQVRELIDYSYKLEGLSRSAGTHAAGVVVADQPLMDLLPLQVITGKEDVVTQWDGPTVESVGLLKMDFLGLRNLTILDKAVKNVERHHGVKIVPKDLPLDDAETFALLQRGETKGIFQLESGGMRDLLTKMRPDKFADIIATSALYRPGPLEGGMVMDYVNVKNGRQEIAKVHPLVDDVLEETYGVMVYQEQVMRILNRVGNLELSAAYRCIKAISKKKLKIIADFRGEYIAGAKANGLDEKLAVDLFELIEKFAGYGFNKSHSTAYGAIAYQTAYLKAHYPHEFMAALLSCGMESSDRINEHVDDARRQGIEVLAPDVNRSDVEFGVDDGRLTFGLSALKGVGESAVAAIVAEREANGPFRDIFDLAERCDAKHVTRGVLEILVKAGALDNFGDNRNQLFVAAERAVQASAAIQRDRAAGQKNLFGGDEEEDDGPAAAAVLPDVPDWPRGQRLAFEKETLGFYLTSHPLAEAGSRVTRHATHAIGGLADLDDGVDVVLAGMVGAIKNAQTKKPSRNGHQKYVNFDLEDESAVVRCIMWPEEYNRQGDLIGPEQIVCVKGRVDRRGREPNVIVNRVFTPDDADREFTTQVAILFRSGVHGEDQLRFVRDALGKYPGETDVVILIESADVDVPGRRVRYKLTPPGYLRVSPGPGLKMALNDILGAGFVNYVGAKA